MLLVGYGIVSRVLRSMVDLARQHGMKAGLFRPITLWPFPSKALVEAAETAAKVMVVELSTGQMVEDVRLAINGASPWSFTAVWAATCPRRKSARQSCSRAWKYWYRRRR